MKKLLLILFFIFGFFSNQSFASDSLDIPKRHRFQIGIKYFNVNNSFVNHSNGGIGIYGAYNYPLFKKLGINGKVALGTDWMIGEGGISKSEWYQNPIWIGAGLEKKISIFSQKDFGIGLGMKGFGISKPDSWLYNPETGERQYDYIDQFRILFSTNINYRINNSPIVLDFGIDLDHYYTLKNLGISYSF